VALLVTMKTAALRVGGRETPIGKTPTCRTVVRVRDRAADLVRELAACLLEPGSPMDLREKFWLAAALVVCLAPVLGSMVWIALALIGS
jgi:hypothetical protein